MKHIPHIILFILRSSFHIFYGIFGLGLLLLLSYFFAFWFLRSPLSGNDAANSLTFISYLDRFWPHIPLWWPLQGNGSSFVLGYPMLYNLIVLWLSHAFKLSIVPTMGIVNFSIVPLVAIGIYIFVFWRFKSQTTALFAGIFFLLSPIGYIYIWGAGFLAQVFSYIFVAPFLMFYDALLHRVLQKEFDKLAGLYMLCAIVFLALSMLAHPATGMGLIFTSFFYTVLILALNIRKVGRRDIIRIFACFLSVVFFQFLIISFWFVPFWNYTKYANRNFAELSADPKTFPPIELAPTFGFLMANKDYAFSDLTVNIVVTFFASLALIFSLFRRNHVLSWTILAFWSLFSVGSFAVTIFLMKYSPFLATFFSMRYALPIAIVLMPVAAGIGILSLSEFLVLPLSMLITKVNHKFVLASMVSLKSILVTILIFGIGGFGIYFFANPTGFYTSNPAYSSNPKVIHYGPSVQGIDPDRLWVRALGPGGIKDICTGKNPAILCTYPYFIEKIDPSTFNYVCDLYNKDPDRYWMCTGSVPPKGKPITKEHVDAFLALCAHLEKLNQQMADLCTAVRMPLLERLTSNWPKIILGKTDTANDDFAGIISVLPQPFLGRIASTPSLGNMAKQFSIAHDVPITGLYTGQIQLNKPLDGYLVETMFSKTPSLSETTVTELAKWYGLDTSVVVDPNDGVEKYDVAKWQLIGQGTQIRIPPLQTGLATIATKPKVLVIGSFEKNAYEQVFRVLTQGGLSYENAMLFEGKNALDDYTLQELQKYSLLILHGYTYHNQVHSWDILKQYVQDGGSVFIDTGWQYMSPDWQLSSTPDVFPVAATTWQAIGQNPSYRISGDNFAKGIVASDFGPLIWGNNDWGISLATNSQLRNFAKPILTVDDNVLIAGGNFGKGKIIWSGINLIPHILDKHNIQEIHFFGNMLSYLLPKEQSKDIAISLKRNSPDDLAIESVDTIPSGSTLYFRESFYPDWHASVEKSNNTSVSLPLIRAGAGFMGAIIPTQLRPGDKIRLQFELSTIEKLSGFLSLLGLFLILLLPFGIYQRLLRQQKLTKTFSSIRIPLFHHGFSSIKKIRDSFNKEDEDY